MTMALAAITYLDRVAIGVTRPYITVLTGFAWSYSSLLLIRFMLKKLAPPDVFRKIVWENGTRLLQADLKVGTTY